MLGYICNMIYKFPRPANLFKELLPAYSGSYQELCVPQSDDEKFCYAELTETQLPVFAVHFGNGETFPDNIDEYPASVQSKISNRIEKFTIVRPGYRESMKSSKN